MGTTHFSAVNPTFPTLTLSITANRTMSAQEAADAGIIDITVDAARDLIFPATVATGKVIIVRNETAATHAVTVKVTGQTGIAIAATKTAILKCNGTDFERVTADA